MESLNRNAATSVVMWGIGVVPMVPAAVWWDNSGALIASIIVFVLFSILYTQMVLDYKHFLLSISLNVLLIVAGLVLNYGFNYFTSFEESL